MPPRPEPVTDDGGRERLLQDLVDSLSDHAIFMLDADGRVASWSAGARRLLGYVEREVKGQSYARFFPPADRRRGAP